MFGHALELCSFLISEWNTEQDCRRPAEMFAKVRVGLCLPVGTSAVPRLCAGAAPPVHVGIFMLLLLLEVQGQQQLPCPGLSREMQLRTRQRRRVGSKGCTQGQSCVQNNRAFPLLQHLSTHLAWDSSGCRWTETADEKLNGLTLTPAAWEWYWSHPKGGICCRPGDFLPRSAYSLH